VDSLFSDNILLYKTVFGYYRKLSEEDVWKSCWIQLLKNNKSKLDLATAISYCKKIIQDENSSDNDKAFC